jgi:membrane protein
LGTRGRKLAALAERALRSFVRHNMAVYAMALAYRGLFALLPFALFLVAVLSFLRVDALLIWLAELGPPGLRGPLPDLIRWLEEGVMGQTEGGLLAIGVALAFWSVAIGARILTRILNAVFEVEETRPAWKRTAASVTIAPALALAVTAAVALMLVTSRAAAWLASWIGLDAIFALLWGLLRIPAALLLLSLVVGAVYRYAPTWISRRAPWCPARYSPWRCGRSPRSRSRSGWRSSRNTGPSTGASARPSRSFCTSTSRRYPCCWAPRSARP